MKRFFKRAFKGILVADFWGAYNAIVYVQKQKCLSHLPGDMNKARKYKDASADRPAFSKRLKRIVRDAMRLRGRRDRSVAAEYDRLCAEIEKHLNRLIREEWENGEAKRLIKRLKRHRKELSTFLYNEGVPPDNNHAERTIRNGVAMRKNGYCTAASTAPGHRRS